MAVKEYDLTTDVWRVVAEASRRRYGCAGGGNGGMLYVASGVTSGARVLPDNRRVMGACGVVEGEIEEEGLDTT